MSNVANSSGAFDFSTLKRSDTDAAEATTQASTNLPSAKQPSGIPVPSLVLDADSKNLANYLNLSDAVPLLVDLYTLRNPQSSELSQKLIGEVVKRGGALVLLRIDADANPQLAQAFQVQQLPSVIAILRSQPISLFSGDQPADSIALVVDKVLEAAAANGVTGTVVADSADAPVPTLPPEHQAAMEAIERGDYEAAEAAYKAALAQAPADALATAGLAQVQLLKRTDTIDYEKVLATDAQDLKGALEKADAHTSIGDFATAFSVILDRFEAHTDERDALRAHLLELFKVAGTDPAVAPARARLTNLLF